MAWKRRVPLDCQTIKNAAVLDVSHSVELTSLPGSLQALASRLHEAACLGCGGLLGACKASICALHGRDARVAMAGDKPRSCKAP